MEKVLIYPTYGERGTESAALAINCRSVNVSSESTLTQAPVETGVLINDCKVRRPVSITVNAVLEIDGEGKWKDTVARLRTMHEQFSLRGEYAVEAIKEKLASVKTKESAYDCMVLVGFPHTEGVEHFSTFEFTLKFQELILAGEDGTSHVSDPSDTPGTSVDYDNYKSTGQ